jgi:hypothetical protein
MTHYVRLSSIWLPDEFRIAGITAYPNGDWTMQAGRNLLDVIDGPLAGIWSSIATRSTALHFGRCSCGRAFG